MKTCQNANSWNCSAAVLNRSLQARLLSLLKMSTNRCGCALTVLIDIPSADRSQSFLAMRQQTSYSLPFERTQQGRSRAARFLEGWGEAGGDPRSSFNHHHSRLTVPLRPHTLSQTAKAKAHLLLVFLYNEPVIWMNGPLLGSHL